MKKNLVSALLALLSASTVLADTFMMGDVVPKDELMIINKTISCSGAVLDDVANPDVSKIIFPVYSMAVQRRDSFNVSGTLNGNNFDIIGNTKTGLVDVSWSAAQDLQPGQIPSNRTSASGFFDDKTSSVHLTVSQNGKYTTIGCTKFVR